jgi:hypothetical protein
MQGRAASLKTLLDYFRRDPVGPCHRVAVGKRVLKIRTFDRRVSPDHAEVVKNLMDNHSLLWRLASAANSTPDGSATSRNAYKLTYLRRAGPHFRSGVLALK